MSKSLNKLGVLNDDGKLSITNMTVYVFLSIVAFRTLFSGAALSFHDFNWKVSDLDISATLPLLFSLMNYGHKRMTLTNSQPNGSPNA